MSVGARLFVGALFVVLGASFVWTTYVLYTEFQQTRWFSIATFYSHVFVFFPTFGILALCSFYIPASALVDLYWRHVPLGPLRFLAGLIAIAGLSWALSQKLLDGDVPALWWLSPQVLQQDRGNPTGCNPQTASCKRVAILDAIATIRAESTERFGLSKFVRNCSPDPLLEPAAEQNSRRYCFASRTMATAPECCTAKNAFTDDLRRLYQRDDSISETFRAHALVLPLKVFFLLSMFVIGILLAVWRRSIDRYYRSHATRIERGIIVGALAMLVWPISNHAFLQSAALLYAPSGEGFYKQASPVFSLMFGAWALMIILFYFRQHQRDIEAAGKIGGGIASAVAVLNYDRIVDFAERFLGSGADPAILVGLIAVLALMFLAMVWGASTPEVPESEITLPEPPTPTS